jgi:hypothetical protein
MTEPFGHCLRLRQCGSCGPAATVDVLSSPKLAILNLWSWCAMMVLMRARPGDVGDGDGVGLVVLRLGGDEKDALAIELTWAARHASYLSRLHAPDALVPTW